MIESRSRS